MRNCRWLSQHGWIDSQKTILSQSGRWAARPGILNFGCPYACAGVTIVIQPPTCLLLLHWQWRDSMRAAWQQRDNSVTAWQRDSVTAWQRDSVTAWQRDMTQLQRPYPFFPLPNYGVTLPCNKARYLSRVVGGSVMVVVASSLTALIVCLSPAW